METRKKVSDSQIKLILIVFTFGIIVSSYFFGFRYFNDKAEKLKKENRELTTESNELKQKNLNKDNVITETAEIKKKADDLLDKFATGFTQEKSIMFINALGNYAGLTLSVINFGDIGIMYDDSIAINVDNNNSSTNQQQKLAPTDILDNENKDSLTAYQTSLTITYKTTYEGLKKCIDYIYSNAERMSISEITATYDNSTGNLLGTMRIGMFALGGTDKTFNNVNIGGVSLGTNNIFGTFEIPVSNTYDIDNTDDVDNAEIE